MDRIQSNIDGVISSLQDQYNDLNNYEEKLKELMELTQRINQKSYGLNVAFQVLSPLFDLGIRNFDSDEKINIDYLNRLESDFKNTQSKKFKNLNNMEELIDKINNIHLNDKLQNSLSDKITNEKKVKI